MSSNFTDIEGMGKKLYVGNLNFRTTDDSLADAFIARGLQVVGAKVIVDRETGRSRGFAFVEFAADEDADRALVSMHDQDVDGRQIKVTEARAKDGAGGGPPRPFSPRPTGSPSAAPFAGPPRETRAPREGFAGPVRAPAGRDAPRFDGPRTPREQTDSARPPFRPFEARAPRPGGSFGAPPPGASTFPAEEAPASRRGRGERRDLRKQHERRDEVFDDDEE